MDQSSQSSNDNVADSLNDLHISEAPVAPLADTPIESNPWQDQLGELSLPTKAMKLHAPDLSAIDKSIYVSSEPVVTPVPESERDTNTEEVLNEFDPLSDRGEQVAREAWALSESHPPPRNIPIPESEASISHSQSPEPPPKDSPNQPSSDSPRMSGSNFPLLSSFTRSLSIPTIVRPRPASIEVAKAVPSPATLSSFAVQQDQRPHDPENSSAVARSSTPIGNEMHSSLSGRERDKEPAFDFQKFLDQMKSKGADPVAKYLRSFLSNFAKRTFTVSDQIKIINDFLHFISARMRETDVWRNATDAEFDNAMEGMEKLVMNRLYEFTFTPQVAQMIPPRPVTADDLERDRVLSQRIALFGWIEEKHLDIPQGEGSKGFIMFAQQELLKLNHYKAPRDKLICILNCCKVIFGLIRHLHKEEGADSFVPILIFIVLKANPEHLLSNVEFISRFRNPAKLQSEAGYYLSSLMGAVSFIETMDHTSLSNITQEEFESNVEDAIQALPYSEPITPISTPATPKRTLLSAGTGPASARLSPHAGEESAQPLALPTPGQTLGEDARRLLQKTGDTISKPLSAIGRIFSEALEEAEGKLINLRQDQQHDDEQLQPKPHWADSEQVEQYIPKTPIGVGKSGQQVGAYGVPLQTPYKPRVKRVPSPSSIQSSASMSFYPEDTPTRGHRFVPSQSLNTMIAPQGMSPRIQALSHSDSQSSSQHVSRTPTPALDLAGIQDEIDQAHDKVLGAARETLVQIFPGVDNEVIEWVLEANEGDLGKSIEGLLEMSSES